MYASGGIVTGPCDLNKAIRLQMGQHSWCLSCGEGRVRADLGIGGL